MASSFRRVVATTLSTDFRKACQVVTENVQTLKKNEVRIKPYFAGINATDINVTAGRYGATDPPFGVGLEGIGKIEEVGEGVSSSLRGQAVAYIHTGSFTESLTLPLKHCLRVPTVKPEYIPLLISGLTASIAFEHVGNLKAGEKVLVTAAAGGTGHIAVQLAKKAGCHVIGTCSSQEKSDLLKTLGCDDVINYKEQDLGKVLKEYYPGGIDVVYESIGGSVFHNALNRLNRCGRMIVIGYIDSYTSMAGIDRSHRDATLITKLLLKSASVHGFFLMNHIPQYHAHLEKLVSLLDSGELKVLTQYTDDNGTPFKGIDSVFDGVDFLYSKKSKGKIIVDLRTDTSNL